MPRLNTAEFWNRFLEYTRAVHDVVEERFREAGEALSHLSSRASALLGRLAARGAERAFKVCIDPMLRDVNLREVIETLFEEMGYFIEVTQPSSPQSTQPPSPQSDRPGRGPASENESTNDPLKLASTINKSITSVVEKLPFWLKALLEGFNELVEIARRK